MATLQVLDGANTSLIVLRCQSSAELEHWKKHLDYESHFGRGGDIDGEKSTPLPKGVSPHSQGTSQQRNLEMQSHTLIFDIGGASVRAGFSGDPHDVGSAWPSLYFPNVINANMTTGERLVGAVVVAPHAEEARRVLGAQQRQSLRRRRRVRLRRRHRRGL